MKDETLVLFILLFMVLVVVTVCAYNTQIIKAETQEAITPVNEDVEVTEVVEIYVDPNNYIYPFNTMSTDWGAGLYESGFKYYEIPEEYIKTGGCFPEVVQAYLWGLCEERGLNYYMVVALIERESGYKWDASGDSGKSKGSMQIQERWHTARMEAEGVEDLYNPYSNIRVGLSYLQEITARAGNNNTHYVLMVYNMGEGKCKKLNSEGIYSTGYSRQILQRAQEIEQALKD